MTMKSNGDKYYVDYDEGDQVFDVYFDDGYASGLYLGSHSDGQTAELLVCGLNHMWNQLSNDS